MYDSTARSLPHVAGSHHVAGLHVIHVLLVGRSLSVIENSETSTSIDFVQAIKNYQQRLTVWINEVDRFGNKAWETVHGLGVAVVLPGPR